MSKKHECPPAAEAWKNLGPHFHDAGSSAILLGTYQNSASASERLEAAEAEEASRLGIHHLSVSGLIRRGREEVPHATCLAADGMHPGADLTLLKSALVLHHIFDSPPSSVAFHVDGDMRDPGLKGESGRSYSANRVAAVLGFLDLGAREGGRTDDPSLMFQPGVPAETDARLPWTSVLGRE